MLRQWAELPHLDIRYQSKNVAKDTKIKRQLLANPKSRALLREANQEDIKLYRFVVEQQFPAMIQSYRGQLEAEVQAFAAQNRPPAVYPRQLGSVLLRELVYKPLAPVLRNRENPRVTAVRRAA